MGKRRRATPNSQAEPLEPSGWKPLQRLEVFDFDPEGTGLVSFGSWELAVGS
jgi:hypothetical protein